jgi:membrane-associated phospholipid phosphatase
VLIIVFGPWLVLGATLVALIGWSRVRLADHTVPQVLAGTVVGAGLAAVTFSLF